MPRNNVFVIELKFRECWAVFSCGIRRGRISFDFGQH